MKRRNFIFSAGTVAVAATAAGVLNSCNPSADLKAGEVLHTVIFDLKHPVGSPEAKKFMSDAYKILTAIPGVRNFQAYRQCSPKNDFQYGFLMTFNNNAEYDTYSDHPDHNKFVEERWKTEVSRFQESDFMQL